MTTSSDDSAYPMSLGALEGFELLDVEQAVEDFICVYDRRPVKDNPFGMKSPHLFWTWYILSKLDPENVIESGVYKGLGTWMIEQACPKARVFSIDPGLEQREYVSDRVRYFSEDFSSIDWSFLDKTRTVIFFDDHQDAYLRLMQMRWMGFGTAIFEDNYPVSQGDCYSLKKVIHGTGLNVENRPVVRPNLADRVYLFENIRYYREFPPLFKASTTRWGDAWAEPDYPTPKPLFTTPKGRAQQLLYDEARQYTWMCLAVLK